MIVATNIVADKPTETGHIYPFDVLQRAIKEFNNRATNHTSKGSELDRNNISKLGEASHKTKRLFINNSGMLCAEIEILDTEAGTKLKEKISESSCLVARPLMVVPNYVSKCIADGTKPDKAITELQSIARVQVECCDNGKIKR